MSVQIIVVVTSRPSQGRSVCGQRAPTANLRRVGRRLATPTTPIPATSTEVPVITLAPGDTQLWDNRFTVTAAPDRSRTATVKALPPETWPYVRERRHNAGLPAEALPRAAALTLPTFWEGDRLLGAAHPQLMLAAGLTGQGLSAEFAWR